MVKRLHFLLRFILDERGSPTIHLYDVWQQSSSNKYPKVVSVSLKKKIDFLGMVS